MGNLVCVHILVFLNFGWPQCFKRYHLRNFNAATICIGHNELGLQLLEIDLFHGAEHNCWITLIQLLAPRSRYIPKGLPACEGKLLTLLLRNVICSREEIVYSPVDGLIFDLQ